MGPLCLFETPLLLNIFTNERMLRKQSVCATYKYWKWEISMVTGEYNRLRSLCNNGRIITLMEAKSLRQARPIERCRHQPVYERREGRAMEVED